MKFLIGVFLAGWAVSILGAAGLALVVGRAKRPVRRRSPGLQGALVPLEVSCALTGFGSPSHCPRRRVFNRKTHRLAHWLAVSKAVSRYA